MTITRFDPFREFAILPRGNWIPPVDIFETQGHDLVIKAELPDVNREDVEVTVENNVLVLSGERKEEKEEKKRNYHRFERFFGEFYRDERIFDMAQKARIELVHIAPTGGNA